MCGIAGYIGKKQIGKASIDKTLCLMKNRGPDHLDWRYFKSSDTNIYLLHSRLSIIDLDKRSNQPFSFNGLTLIFNGEIYNYIEVRSQLTKLGYSFSTNSDTEVLLKAYLEYGEKCVQYFNGMWAFAIWDEHRKKLFLSRDRFAEKPLYYFHDNDGFYFASEIKAIQSLREKKLQINYDHLKRYLVYGYKFLQKTPETYFHGIREIEFASNASVSTDINFNQCKYWKPKSNVKQMTMKEAIDGSRHYLLDAVELRLRADVPLAFCLSGGVDSASLASIAKKKFNYDVATFSIIDSDERYNESDNIQATVDDLDCNHSKIQLNFENMLERLQDLVAYHDAPISTISYLIHSMLSEKINECGYRIAVSGTAADELFTGYYDHFNLHLYEMRNHINFQKYLEDWQKYTGNYVRNPYLKNPKLYFENQSIRDHNHLNSSEFSSFLNKDFSIEITESRYTESLLRNRMLNELFHEATPIILNEDDLNSMKYSIENRSPYLDVNLFDFANSIPNEYLIQGGHGKYVLREAMNGILNDQVRLDRKKKGFNASITSLFDFSDINTYDYFLDPSSAIFDLINFSSIERLINSDLTANHYSKFLFNFINCKIFIDQQVKF
jgi:asparagine synthase (glutamine-hydrolysing)